MGFYISKLNYKDKANIYLKRKERRFWQKEYIFQKSSGCRDLDDLVERKDDLINHYYTRQKEKQIFAKIMNKCLLSKRKTKKMQENMLSLCFINFSLFKKVVLWNKYHNFASSC